MPLPKNSPLPIALLLVLALLPALTTWSAFYLEIFPFLLYPLAKTVLVVLPFAVWSWRDKDWRAGLDHMGLQRPSWRGLVSGALLSAIICGAFVLFGADLDATAIRLKLVSLGLIDHYWGAAFFLCAVNSAFEEWYWRGFLLDELRNRVKQPAVIVGLGGLFFGCHHYFTLRPFFHMGLTLLLTCATMLAGALWSWHRLRGWSLADCYVSHLCVDLIVVIIGAILLF